MTEEKRPLTPEDPVSPEILAQFTELTSTKQRIALSLLQIEQDRIELVRAAKRIDDQSQRLFESCLVDRGLPITTQLEIDSTTGKITLQNLPE